MKELHIVLWNDSKMVTGFVPASGIFGAHLWCKKLTCTSEQLGAELIIKKLQEGYDTILIHTEKEWLAMGGPKEA